MSVTVGPFGYGVPEKVKYYTRPLRRKVSRFSSPNAKSRTGRSTEHKRAYRSCNAGLSAGINMKNSMKSCSFIWLGGLCIRFGNRF